MDPLTLIFVVGIIILTSLAIKFLVGMLRTVITVALVLLAAGLIMGVATEYDPLSVKPTAATVLEHANNNLGDAINAGTEAIQGTSNAVNETSRVANEAYQQIKN